MNNEVSASAREIFQEKVLQNFAPIIDAFQELNQEKQNLIQENNFIKELNILLTEKIIYLVGIIKEHIEKDGSDGEENDVSEEEKVSTVDNSL